MKMHSLFNLEANFYYTRIPITYCLLKVVRMHDTYTIQIVNLLNVLEHQVVLNDVFHLTKNVL